MLLELTQQWNNLSLIKFRSLALFFLSTPPFCWWKVFCRRHYDWLPFLEYESKLFEKCIEILGILNSIHFSSFYLFVSDSARKNLFFFRKERLFSVTFFEPNHFCFLHKVSVRLPTFLMISIKPKCFLPTAHVFLYVVLLDLSMIFWLFWMRLFSSHQEEEKSKLSKSFE